MNGFRPQTPLGLTNLTTDSYPSAIWSTWSREPRMQFVNLYEQDPLALVEQAAAGEEIIIAKNGVARARLVPIAARTTLGVRQRAPRQSSPRLQRAGPRHRRACSRAGTRDPAARYPCLPLVGQRPRRTQSRCSWDDRGRRQPRLVGATSVWEIAIKRRAGKTRRPPPHRCQRLRRPGRACRSMRNRRANSAWSHADPLARLLVVHADGPAATLADRRCVGGSVPLLWAG